MGVCASIAGAQQVDWEVPPRTRIERAVARVDSIRLIALLSRDTAVVRRIYADDFRSILPSGAVRTKPEFLRDLGTGHQRYDTVYHTGQRIEVVGGVAIITGRSTQRGREARPSTSLVAQTRYVRVYVHRQGRWQLVYTQLTAIRDSSRGAGYRHARAGCCSSVVRTRCCRAQHGPSRVGREAGPHSHCGVVAGPAAADLTANQSGRSCPQLCSEPIVCRKEPTRHAIYCERSRASGLRHIS